ncbi:MAG: divergent polysaccharide deacetylase family protein [Candidatus Omnitrophica bacterium]|nr:divergent polysaccharide deacetylase family protein [Candidatus Omnitrophota bacterium]
MRALKIFFSVVFVLVVGFFVARSCVHRAPPAGEDYGLGPAPAKRKVQVVPPPAAAIPATTAAPVQPKGRIAVILDDWGNRYSVFKHAVDVGRPLTLSILPHLPQSRRIAEAAHQNNLGVMLHMPMQPRSKTDHLEAHMILTTMPDDQIASLTEAALASIPHAEGANNHMGSAATADARVMRVFLSTLKRKGLFFVDSATTSKTAGPRVAGELGVKFIKRDIFLDNELKKEAVRKQLELAKRVALRRGAVVVIGHDYRLTLETLREVAPEFEKEGIRFVLVKELLE